MFDIERIDIMKCAKCGCSHYRCERRKASSLPDPSVCAGTYYRVAYCKLDVYERYYECPLFRADVDRITDIIRFEVKQVTIKNNKHIKELGWHIFDNDYGHLIDLIDTFDYEDKDKADKLCEWLNKVNGRSKHLEEMSVNE